MDDKIIKFIYNSNLQKWPKNYRILYLLKKIKLWPGEFINVNMKLSVHFSEQIIATCVLLPILCKNELCMESFQYILADGNICNTSQPVNSSWKIHFELVIRCINTVFSIWKRSPYNLKQWSGRIKSVIYKDNKHFKCYLQTLVLHCSKINSSYALTLLFSFLPLCSSLICQQNFTTNCCLVK